MLLIFLSSCKPGNKAFNPYKKYNVDQLRVDYDLYRSIIQERHPSLYWYSSKPFLDSIFDVGRKQITDSLTEYEFRKILALVNTNLQCGHTLVRASKKYLKYADKLKEKASFPLAMKIWGDTVAVAQQIYRQDSVLTRGALLDSLNGLSAKFLLDTMYHYVIADGNNLIAKNQVLSTATYFGSLYTSLYGWKPAYKINFIDSSGHPRETVIKPYKFLKDSTFRRGKAKALKMPKVSKRQKRLLVRSLKINDSANYAVMEINSFSEKFQLKRFFRHSFRQLGRSGVHNLVIDLRSNGGGRVSNSNLLARYLAEKPFKIGDSLYAITRQSSYSRYIQADVWARLFMFFVTHKKEDGNFHFGYYERHSFKPKGPNHFDGTVYILSGGNTFSASTLVINILKPQQNVILLGEPTGGAAYGNSAWIIPEVTLPNTRVRFRLPLFRLVINKNLPKDGQGILPEIWVGPTIEAIKHGRDYKMEKALEMIKSSGN